MEINSDLHIHSKYSAATSQRMDFHILTKEAEKKGIHLLGTGDCLHPEWLREIKELKEEDGIFFLGKTRFILTVEVEDARKVHHLLIVPSISKAEELYEVFSKRSTDIDSNGRPRIRMTGEEIAESASDAGALVGPCHAFTPWTALYAYHNSLEECYGDMKKNVSFVELGLSADTSYADRISELRDITFLTNSDAHSPWPIRLAREFNRFFIKEINFEEIKKAILRKGGRKPVLNVGIPPEEGKYNESACIRCFRHYTLRECTMKNWRCQCGGKIKKGVRDRVEELTDTDAGSPDHRPPYLHLIPLAEIISLALNSDSNAKEVKEKWNELVRKHGNEVEILVDLDINKIDDPRISEAIGAFREGKIIVHPGGGGRYGKIEIGERKIPPLKDKQLSLSDFC
ncbi:MAG: TIGR00375 family protein [Candidatus Syntropharchaeia archaeon]